MADETKQRILDKMREDARKDFESGLISKNEYREAFGLPPLPPDEGNVFYVPEGQQRIHQDDLGKLPLLRGIEPKEIEKYVKRAKGESH